MFTTAGLLLWIAAAGVTASLGPAVVSAQTSVFSAVVPSGWTTQAAPNGRALAALGPAFPVRGSTFHPNVSITASEAAAGVTLDQAAAVTETALARSLPALRRLGLETADGASGPVRIGYYLGEVQSRRLYVVTGVVLVKGWIIVTLGATSPELAAYREHAALFRASALSVRAR